MCDGTREGASRQVREGWAWWRRLLGAAGAFRSQLTWAGVTPLGFRGVGGRLRLADPTRLGRRLRPASRVSRCDLWSFFRPLDLSTFLSQMNGRGALRAEELVTQMVLAVWNEADRFVRDVSR